MITFTAIVELLTKIFASIPYFSKWVTKPTEQKNEEGSQAVDQKIDHEQSTGRPE